MMFFDPADLAAVLDDTMEAHEPQSVATLDMDEALFLQATVETAVIRLVRWPMIVNGVSYTSWNASLTVQSRLFMSGVFGSSFASALQILRVLLGDF